MLAAAQARFDGAQFVGGWIERGRPVAPQAIDEGEVVGGEPALGDAGDLEEAHDQLLRSCAGVAKRAPATRRCGTATVARCEKAPGASAAAA